MPKKPSEWTPQEAWQESAKAHCVAWDVENAMTLHYPSDPPERVSDGDLEWMASPHVDKRFADKKVEMMALELIERRKADKEQGR